VEDWLLAQPGREWPIRPLAGPRLVEEMGPMGPAPGGAYLPAARAPSGGEGWYFISLRAELAEHTEVCSLRQRRRKW